MQDLGDFSGANQVVRIDLDSHDRESRDVDTRLTSWVTSQPIAVTTG